MWKLNDSPKLTWKEAMEELRLEPTPFCFLCNHGAKLSFTPPPLEMVLPGLNAERSSPWEPGEESFPSPQKVKTLNIIKLQFIFEVPFSVGRLMISNVRRRLILRKKKGLKGQLQWAFPD